MTPPIASASVALFDDRKKVKPIPSFEVVAFLLGGFLFQPLGKRRDELVELGFLWGRHSMVEVDALGSERACTPSRGAQDATILTRETLHAPGYCGVGTGATWEDSPS